MSQVIKKPGAFLPLIMSGVAIAFVIVYVAIFGITKQSQADEGIAARIFQMLLAGQLPIMMFFALRWLPKMPKKVLPVLAIQAIAIISAFGLVFFLER